MSSWQEAFQFMDPITFVAANGQAAVAGFIQTAMDYVIRANLEFGYFYLKRRVLQQGPPGAYSCYGLHGMDRHLFPINPVDLLEFPTISNGSRLLIHDLPYVSYVTVMGPDATTGINSIYQSTRAHCILAVDQTPPPRPRVCLALRER